MRNVYTGSGETKAASDGNHRTSLDVRLALAPAVSEQLQELVQVQTVVVGRPSQRFFEGQTPLLAAIERDEVENMVM